MNADEVMALADAIRRVYETVDAVADAASVLAATEASLHWSAGFPAAEARLTLEASKREADLKRRRADARHAALAAVDLALARADADAQARWADAQPDVSVSPAR